MRFNTVNYWLIWQALGFLEITEAMKGAPLGLDPNDELSAKAAFERHVRPEVRKWPKDRIERLKLSFAYFIDRPEILENRILANIPNLTMAEPSDIRQFFIWLWECLFPAERLAEINTTKLQEDNDIMDVNP